MTVRTRIAPSPTGFMHIGTLRTMLFNIFLAKQQGGQFIIRIEDTDQKREVEGAVEALLRTIKRLGLAYDEGPVVGGPHAPYVQSERLPMYKQAAEELVASGHAYHCFCSAETLEEMRAAQAASKQTTKYDRRCLALPKEEIAARLSAGHPFVIRMKVPEGKTTFEDAVRGSITIDHAEVDDQVLVKSDGFPTYHLAVVVDDHDMEITHVLRGEEWLPSTPKQIILYTMFGWEVPVFAHIPLLLNPDKKKLSKRQGDVATEDFLKKGYLPSALMNFVGTLGFNPSADREIYRFDELVQLFDLSRVNRAGAVMNLEKLNWMNRQYLKEMSEEEFLQAAADFVPAERLEDEKYCRAYAVERLRIDRLDQLAMAGEQYFATQSYEANLLIWKKADKADALTQLSQLKELTRAGEFPWNSVQTIEERVRAHLTEQGIQPGNALWPLRVALSGLERSASPFEYLYVLGKEESLTRIDKAIDLLS